MQAVKSVEENSVQALFRRVRGAQEAELFGPRGRLPRRGEADTARNRALLILGGLILVAVLIRVAVPRGIWLDEAISVHQARLSLHGLFANLYSGDRNPPLYHLALWLTIRVFGHGEAAIRLPSLIAGLLVIPVLYALGRELYDRRTGLLAAAFAVASPLLVWYAQEVRMYAFVALFGLLALLTQLRVLNRPTFGNWAAYILATAALLWSQYFGLLVVGVQQLIFVGVLIHRRRRNEPVKGLGLGFAYALAILAMQLVPYVVFAQHQFSSTHAAAGSPTGTYDPLSFYSLLANMAWSLWGYQPDTVTVLLAALWPLFLLISLALLGRGGSRQTLLLATAAITPVVLLIVVSAFDRSLFEVRYFLLAVPLLLLLVARLITGWIRKPQARLLAAVGVIATLAIGLLDQQVNHSNPRLYDFKAAVQDIKADGGPNSAVLYEPADMRYVLEYYAPGMKGQPLTAAIAAQSEGSPLFVLASFQSNKQFFTETNKIVGQLTFFRKLVARFKTPQTMVWEFR
ncbi:MAG TPA: glycosyltransferase family 39 protein [Chloroflexota bacterium]|nr:glycosyltransferase family 39 protein [Chloroflexota bacterium]